MLLAFDADAVLLAVHDWVFAAHHAADRAQCLGELVPRRHRRALLSGHVLGLPGLELRHVGFRPGVPGLRGFVPHGAGRLGGDAFAVGNGEILARRGGWRLLGPDPGSGRRRPSGKGGWIDTGRDIPGLFLTIPARTQRFRLVLLRVGNVDPDLAELAGLADRVYLTGLGSLLLAFVFSDLPLQVLVVEERGDVGRLARFSGCGNVLVGAVGVAAHPLFLDSRQPGHLLVRVHRVDAGVGNCRFAID